MKLEGNFGNSYHGMRRLAPPGREQQITKNRAEESQLK